MATADVVSLLYTMTYGLIAYALPAYLTFKSLEHKGDADVRGWAVYWTVLALLTCVHTLLDCTLCWLPGYYLLKLGFMAALWHPSTRLAAWIYDRTVGPLLGSYEADIDSAWREAWTRASDISQHQAVAARASVQRISGKVSVMISQAMHKQQSKAQQQQQQQRMSGVGAGAGGAASYVGSTNMGAGGMGGVRNEAPGRGLHTE
eukprot:GHRQ01000908.1.p2 GENE.GHRQ01000908.1~~GHRQ01000908.1.p2  ORF type:complete len:204 (+),score=88.24 GHRQ01000908.1:396-1007(+)